MRAQISTHILGNIQPKKSSSELMVQAVTTLDKVIIAVSGKAKIPLLQKKNPKTCNQAW